MIGEAAAAAGSGGAKKVVSVRKMSEAAKKDYKRVK